MRKSTLLRPIMLGLAALGIAACGSDLPTDINRGIAAETAKLPDIPGALMSQARLDTVMRNGPYAGFDTYTYPGDSKMESLRESGKYDWVGYYLVAPCHKDDSWNGKRDKLESMGWGTAVVYVGQQSWGRTPAASNRIGSADDCSSSLLGANRGEHDGRDAITKAKAEGFTEGSVIFLDIERMERVPKAMRDYYLAWTKTLLADGRYRPGYYVHTANAALIHSDVDPLFSAKGLPASSFWIAGGKNFSTRSDPTAVGHAFANVWQGVIDIVEKHGSVKLPLDINVAGVPSPSSAEFAVTAP